MSDELKRAWDEADRLRGVIRDVCSAMDPSGHVAAENVEQKAEEMRKEIERLTDPVDGLEAKLVERTAEREEARDWVRRLTREQRVLTCAFCGAEYPPGTPESNDAALTAHVRVCPKHPMRETEAEVSRLTDALDTAETCRESLRKGLEQASEQIAEMTAEAKVATAEIEQLRDTVHNYKALLAAAESAGREVCDERDAWKEQAGANAHGCQEQKTFREAAEAERDDARTDIAKAQSLLVKIGAPEHMIGRHDEDPRATLREQIGALRHVFWSIATDRGKAKIPNGVPWADAAEEEARRLRADLLKLGAPNGPREAAEAERDDARRLVTLERRVGRWMSTEDEEALRRLRREATKWDGSKVDPPVRRARHDRHCMIGDGVGCSHEPGCEVER